MFDKSHFHSLVIQPTLTVLDQVIPHSVEAEALLLGTAISESSLMYLKQGLYKLSDGLGVALGPYMVEPAIHIDVWENFIVYRQELNEFMRVTFGLEFHDLCPANEKLITDLAYATAIARLIYWRRPEVLPGMDGEGLARYHEQHFNTIKGAIGRTSDVLEHVQYFVDAIEIVGQL